MEKIDLTGELLTITDGDKEILCRILFTYESEEFGKNYVVFYELDQEEDENEEIKLSAASYKQTDGAIGELEPVESDEEWALLEEILEQYSEDLANLIENDEEECGYCCSDDCECDDDCDCDCDDEECHSCGCHHDEEN